MKKIKTHNPLLSLIAIFILSCSCGCSKDSAIDTPKKAEFVMPEKAIVITNQADASIVIADVDAKKVVWKWTATIGKVNEEHRKWFSNPSDVKPVYNNTCILMAASGGGVALIRIADKKTLFYGYAGVNPHSAELLPDGNIVTASSTDGILATFRTDTIKGFGTMVAKYDLPAAHNVYWDKKRNKLYSAAHTMHIFDYNGDKEKPLLKNHVTQDIDSPDGKLIGTHELFPIEGEEDMLWLATNQKVWKYNLRDNSVKEFSNFYAIKSVSNSSHGIIMLCPKEEWWADDLIDETGKTIFRSYGFKIYKARWIGK